MKFIAFFMAWKLVFSQTLFGKIKWKELKLNVSENNAF
ncbi:hypothetical protein LA2_01950 [Lactobacillus amylovorus GRL 1112]|uniref:Uncharacterized protein n=1 Tax=Lactobacillus amylovorus (strain GRL 1112) TaxID=695560 RepID=E4SL45_LACAR|nr:hypothetical protein LA2_01950 [Lactobacillus amylovorus GRL 1112]